MSSQVSQVIEALDFSGISNALATGGIVTAPPAAAAFLIAAHVKGAHRANRQAPVIVLTANSGEEIFGELKSVLPSLTIAHFPSWETLPHERLSPQSDTVAQRFATLQSIRRNECDVAIVPIRSMIQPFIKDFGLMHVPAFVSGNSLEMDIAIKTLLQLG